MKNQSVFLWFLVSLVLFAAQPTFLLAQKKDNFGKEFYLAFAENQGSGDESKNFMGLFITSKVATKGTVDVAGLGWSQTFTTTPGAITIIELPDGEQFGDPTVELKTDEKVDTGMAVHVTSDDDIAIFGMNHKEFSSDAFLALPVTVLGTTYRALSYPTSALNSSPLPGQIWIAAAFDGTTVTITPNAATANGVAAGTQIKIPMSKGDAYLVQGDRTDVTNDLTGSLIESDKPIAVFSGHVRTEVPNGAKNVEPAGSTSRDHLVEQMPPVTIWGSSALIVPYATATLPDLVRIVSNDNGNQISINGTVAATINAGEFFEITQLTGAVSVIGSKPILVGQYMHTSKFGNNSTGGTAYGDPAYSLVFPVEQFDTAYTFMVDVNPAAFSRNFVNVVTCESGFSGLLLDGKKITVASNPIPGSNYVFASIDIAQGNHHISGSQPLGITVYAFGNVDSYSYPGGSLLDPSRVIGKNITFQVSAGRAINDTQGVTIRLPIFLKSPEKLPSLDMILHYPVAPMKYLRTESLSGNVIDVAGQNWTGRSKLHYSSADLALVTDSLIGHSVFQWYYHDVDCAPIIYDSISTNIVNDACAAPTTATANPSFGKGEIGSYPGCGVRADVRNAEADQSISFYPNPTRESGSLLSNEYTGSVQITIIDILGKRIRSEEMQIEAGAPLELDLNSLAEGIFYLRIASSVFSKMIPFVHLK